MPEVARKGAYRSDLTYGADDLEEIQKYGIARGVEVIIEIDMPGHIGSLAWSHPELIVAYDAFPYFWWCAEPPCGAFKLNNSAVDTFLGKLFADLLPRVAPYSAYFHTGGDELNANDSMLDPDIRSNSSTVLQPLLQKFINANHAPRQEARPRAHGVGGDPHQLERHPRQRHGGADLARGLVREDPDEPGPQGHRQQLQLLGKSERLDAATV